MSIDIKLNVEKTVSCLAGYPNGEKMYLAQVKPYFKPEEKLDIYIPEYIEDIAISFVQGFCADMVKKIGVQGVKKMVIFHHPNEELIEDIQKSLD